MVLRTLAVLCLIIALSDGRAVRSKRATFYKACSHGGHTFEMGKLIIDLDKCESCSCVAAGDDTKVECKEIEGCGSCEFDGKYYKKGESFEPNECFSCVCVGSLTTKISCTFKQACLKKN